MSEEALLHKMEEAWDMGDRELLRLAMKVHLIMTAWNLILFLLLVVGTVRFIVVPMVVLTWSAFLPPILRSVGKASLLMWRFFMDGGCGTGLGCIAVGLLVLLYLVRGPTRSARRCDGMRR